MRVLWSDDAQADRDAILSWLLERNPAAALRVAEALILAGDSLSDLPERGRPGRIPGTRELVAVPPYLIIYALRGEEVLILRIWHGARDRG